jgi:predicted RNase H-like nuclease (RuvC/YqgF family)
LIERFHTIVGIDPDSKAHGVAVYEDGKLVRLANLHAMDVIELRGPGVVFAVENVMENGFLYDRYKDHPYKVKVKIAMNVGRCQQSQLELTRLFDRFGCPHEPIKPQAGNWADDEDRFKLATGWTGRSNHDQRSAAFFGHLLLGDLNRAQAVRDL